MNTKATEQVFCYVGKCACGCGAVRAASVDLPKYKKDTAKFVSDLIRDGMQVDRMEVEKVRLAFSSCKNQGQLAL
jgi:hypothetical protein